MMPVFQHSRYYFVTEWITYLVVHQNIIAPALLVILDEAGIPLPIPGDFIIAYLGYQVSAGHITYAAAFTFILVCAIVGSTVLYFLAARYGERLVHIFGKFTHLNERKLKSVERQFKRYGAWVIIFGRHIPGLRIPITAFAGLSGISYPTFIISTIISTVFGIMFYLAVGQRLGPKTTLLLHGHPRFVIAAFFPALLFFLMFLLLRYHNARKAKKQL